MFYPQIYDVTDPGLSDSEFPPMEMPARATFLPTNIYLCFNALQVFLYIGNQADQSNAPNPQAITHLFNVPMVTQIDANTSEEAIFSDSEDRGGYVQALYSIIN